MNASIYQKTKGLEHVSTNDWITFNNEINKLINCFPKIKHFPFKTLEFKHLPHSLAYYCGYDSLIVLSTKYNINYSSFVHEIAHHLDYQYINDNGKVQEYTKKNKKPSFKRLVQMFREHHSQHASKQTWITHGFVSTTRTEWSSIDKDYRSAVEIFARAFEIYIATQTDIKMIVPTIEELKDNIPAYPLEEFQIENIKEFFDMFFDNMNTKRVA